MALFRSVACRAGSLGNLLGIVTSGASPARLFQTSAAPDVRAGTSSSIPLRTGRPRLVILGSGWGAARLARDIDASKWDLTLLSPRNHMVFTPLLASTCVGTLETRSVTVPVMDIQPALRAPQNFFYAASAVAVHPRDRLVEARSEDGIRFFVGYDALAIATGSQGSTFGIPGVEEHTYFLRDASHSTAIRNALISCWNRANIPGRTDAERARLLHVVVVGGGPTGVEFAGELSDFINRDLRRLDPDRARDMRVTLIEADQLLGSFDARLREYAARKLVAAGVHLSRGIVKEVHETAVELTSGNIIHCGLCVWSTGVGPTEFTLSLPFAKTPKGRIAIDASLRVLARPGEAAAAAAGEKGSGPLALADVSIVQDEEAGGLDAPGAPVPGVFALGDCCADLDSPLPALAQVAEQQGRYLAKRLNATASAPVDGDSAAAAVVQPFKYRPLGSMASVGGMRAIVQLDRKGRHEHLSWGGFSSWVAWRSAYLTRLGTWKHRVYVATNWTLSLFFGRDISRW